MKVSVVALATLALVAYVAADVYMQVPSGSNNRLNEANTNRNNNNRLFDSQNNGKGGYCYGPALSYYEGSQLTIEWTSQHGCGSPKQECNIVLQYMCGKYNNPVEEEPLNQIRDGGSTNGLPDDATAILQAATDDVDGMGYEFGMHENYYWNQWCVTRERNQGLYTADRSNQINNGAGARATRQNNGGGRSGYECAEERDYWPYWHPAPWKDIAVLVDDTSLCTFFQSESQNVKAKGYCYDQADPDAQTQFRWARENNPASCAQAGHTWDSWPSWGIDKPDCVQNSFQRDNHLGNVAAGFNAYYNWTLPNDKQEPCIKDDNCNCVLRLRYNISTVDFSGYKAPFADSTNNDGAAFLYQDPDLPAVTDDCEGDGTEPCNVTLAIDTSQFARTFQDRSYVFHIQSRPSGVAASARIYNLNVKGKRGNIVQTYPATEYDFHPNELSARVGDYIHFQWTGCDTNPAGNAGEGTAGTDRSNMVQIEDIGKSVPASESFLKKHALFESKDLRYKMAFLDQSACKTYAELENTDADQDVANCMNLNAAEPYFNAGLIKMNKTGTFYYMNSRNNNFTNRGQKGSITVSRILPDWGIAVVSVGGALFALSMGAGGAMIYAKSHPHSALSNYFSKL